MNIRQLQYFVAICEKNSLTAVSRDFYISQQGLSSALKKMEAELELQIFTRTSKGVEPNEYAEAILPHAQLITQEYRMLMKKLDSKRSNASGRFSFHVNRIFLDILPVGTEAKMDSAFPDIVPDITDAVEKEALRSIDDETADLALVSGPVDPAKYTRDVLYSCPYIAVVKKGSSLADKKMLYIRELKDESIMIVSDTSNMHHNFLEKCRKEGFQPNVYLFASDTKHLVTLCSDTDGVGITSAFYGKYFPGHLVSRIPIGDEDFFWTIELVRKKSRAAERHVRLWLDLYARLAKAYFAE